MFDKKTVKVCYVKTPMAGYNREYTVDVDMYDRGHFSNKHTVIDYVRMCLNDKLKGYQVTLDLYTCDYPFYGYDNGLKHFDDYTLVALNKLVADHNKAVRASIWETRVRYGELCRAINACEEKLNIYGYRYRTEDTGYLFLRPYKRVCNIRSRFIEEVKELNKAWLACPTTDYWDDARYVDEMLARSYWGIEE